MSNHKDSGRPPPVARRVRCDGQKFSEHRVNDRFDASTDYIVSLAAKAKKVGGLYLTLNGVAVKPTDAVDAKKEYELVAIDGSSSGGEVTPVRPE